MRVGILLWDRARLDLNASGGVELVALKEAEYLNKKDIDALLFVKEAVGVHEKIRKINLSKKYDRKAYLYYLQFILRNITSDAWIAVHCPKLSLVSPKRTIVSFGHRAWLPFYKYVFFRNRYKSATFVFCSEFLKRDFLQRYPEIPPHNCHVIYNGVDVDKFRPSSNKKSNGPVKILFVGQWNEQKGILVLLDAIKILEKKRYGGFELVLVGGPHLWKVDEDYQKQKVTGEKINGIISGLSSVRILGEVAHSDLPPVYQSCDILVFPSIGPEGFGLVNIEAMACGLPVVATRVGGVPEIVLHGKTGFLVEPNDAESLAHSLEDLMDNKQMREKYGAKGRERVEQIFTWDRHINKLIELINHIKEGRDG